MAFNLDQFRSNFQGGGARTALFEMLINFPPILAVSGVAKNDIRAQIELGSEIGRAHV